MQTTEASWWNPSIEHKSDVKWADGVLTGRLDGRACMLSSWLLLLEAMGWLEGGALDWELKESWESSWLWGKAEENSTHVKKIKNPKCFYCLLALSNVQQHKTNDRSPLGWINVVCRATRNCDLNTSCMAWLCHHRRQGKGIAYFTAVCLFSSLVASSSFCVFSCKAGVVVF